MSFCHLRIARPVSDLLKSSEMYCRGLNLEQIGSFSNHQGFSGYMLGRNDLGWHLEFTQCHDHPLSHSPSQEDLLVLYIPEKESWEAACLRMDMAGFIRTLSFNPYWDIDGATFVDHDGYRVVLQNRKWQ